MTETSPGPATFYYGGSWENLLSIDGEYIPPIGAWVRRCHGSFFDHTKLFEGQVKFVSIEEYLFKGEFAVLIHILLDPWEQIEEEEQSKSVARGEST